MLMESKTTYFILISLPAPFHPVKASEMKQETARARHPVKWTKESKQKSIWRKSRLKNSMPLLKHPCPIISSVFYYLPCSGRYFLFNAVGMVSCCIQWNNGHIVIFLCWAWFQLQHIQCTRNSSSSETGAAVCLCKQSDGVPHKPENEEGLQW